MDIFIDSADVNEIAKWLAEGVIDGVTTNPSILVKDGAFDMERRAKEIASLVGSMPVSLEVTSNEPDEMLAQARRFAALAPNIVVKIPIINEHGLPCTRVIRTLELEGVTVNATACLSFSQVVLVAKAGATYASIFAGRVADEGHDAPRLIAESTKWLEHWHYKTKIIIGSIREVINIQDAAMAGAHVITIPPQFLTKMIDHQNTRATVAQFIGDARRAMARLAQDKVGALS